MSVAEVVRPVFFSHTFKIVNRAFRLGQLIDCTPVMDDNGDCESGSYAVLYKLKSAFDTCEYIDKDTVRISDLIEASGIYEESSPEAAQLHSSLDINRTGLISFEDLCFTISNFFNEYATEPNESPRQQIEGADAVVESLEPVGEDLLVSKVLEVPDVCVNGSRKSSLSVSSTQSESYESFGDQDVSEPSLFSNKMTSTPKRLLIRSLNDDGDDCNSVGSENHSDVSSDMVLMQTQIEHLSSKLRALQRDREGTEEFHNLLKHENKDLKLRLSHLEELFETQRVLAEKVAMEERENHQKLMIKVKRENDVKIDQLQIKLQEAEKQINLLNQRNPILQKELELARKELNDATERVIDLENELRSKSDQCERLSEELVTLEMKLKETQYRNSVESLHLKEMYQKVQHLLELSREADSERTELEQQLALLRKENEELKTSRFLAEHSVFPPSPTLQNPVPSLADEMGTADRDNIIKVLNTVEEERCRLQEYVDRLLLLILESHPSLLERDMSMTR